MRCVCVVGNVCICVLLSHVCVCVCVCVCVDGWVSMCVCAHGLLPHSCGGGACSLVPYSVFVLVYCTHSPTFIHTPQGAEKSKVNHLLNKLSKIKSAIVSDSERNSEDEDGTHTHTPHIPHTRKLTTHICTHTPARTNTQTHTHTFSGPGEEQSEPSPEQAEQDQERHYVRV